MSTSFLKAARLTHLYLGVFVAPAILFFAFTGAIQTFSLHEFGKGGPDKPPLGYLPPRWATVLAQIHKNQTPVVGLSRPRPPAPPADPAKPAPKPEAPKPPPGPALPQHNPMPLKYFFALVAWSLFISTLTGIYMAYKYNRNKLVITALLVLGTVIPVLMVIL